MKRLFGLLLCLAGAAAQAAPAAKLPYTYLRIGSKVDASASLQGGTVLMGGGSDVDEAFAWMCNRSQGGDFLVIRATGTDAYNPYIDQVCTSAGARPNSVATLIIPSLEAAKDPRVAAIIQAAEAVWIAGGDQSNYINFWKGTPVQAALNARIAAGAPVGGTSAGLNVLTPFVYSAQASKGVTSSQALADPFNKLMSFERNFAVVPALANTLGDPHFAERDRMGRDLAFLCRVQAAGWSALPRGIAVDEATALLVDPDTRINARVVGAGSVYFLQPAGTPEVCRSGQPLTWLNVGVYRIETSGSFRLDIWSGTGGAAYTVSADRGALSTTGGSIY